MALDSPIRKNLKIHALYHLKSKWIISLSAKLGTIELIKENVGENIYDP